jgi:hypothetical protein
MDGARGTERHGRLAVALCTGLIALAGACGNGAKPESTKSAADAGEPCTSPGVTATGCACSAEQPAGTRQCVASTLIWTQCVCPPPVKALKCTEGQPVICMPCHGETTGRTTTCLRGGTYDCACPSTGSDMDGG